MSTTIAIIAPGAMGSGLARRLHQHDARVLTSLEGRSAASARRAAEAGMVTASEAEIARADIILSIVPPGEATAVAQHLASIIGTFRTSPVVVDCNAVNVETVRKIAAIVSASSAHFIDAAIIGGPPKPDDTGPALYVCGEYAGDVAILKQLGVDLRLIDGPVGAASALKMCYAGINKGLTGLGTAMVLAATRTGAADALRDELALSQPDILARLAVVLPDMLPKAYRWVAEMREIADFLGTSHPAHQIFEGFARLFDEIARDAGGEGVDVARLTAFAENCKTRT